MIARGYEWRGYWEEPGSIVDDEKSVPIRVGVLDVEGQLSLAISVARSAPVLITGRTAAGLAELMQWAQEEHAMLAEQHQRCRTEDAGEALGRAALTRRQWQAVLDALTSTDPTDMTGAAATLRAAAPRTWVGEAPSEEPNETVHGADIRQIITALDNIDGQLNDITSQLQELGDHLAPHDIRSARRRVGERERGVSANDDSPEADADA